MCPFGFGEKKNKPDLENLESKVDLLLQLFEKQLEMSVQAQSSLLEFLQNPAFCASACEASTDEKPSGHSHEENRLATRAFSQKPDGLEEIAKLRKKLAKLENELAAAQLDLKNEKAAQSSLQSEIDSLESENQSLRIERAKEAEARQKFENDDRDCRNRLEDALIKLGEAERRLANAESQRKLVEEKLIISEDSQKRAESALRDARRNQLRDQQKLFDLQEMLENLSDETRRVAPPYRDTRNLEAFLVQCGQFERVKYVWEACGKAVASGSRPEEFSKFLRSLIYIYNLASNENPAALLEARPGEAYKNDLHFRVKSDGSRVRGMLLPALRNAGGKIVQQALVSLE